MNSYFSGLVSLAVLVSKHFCLGTKAIPAIALFALLASFPLATHSETAPGEAAHGESAQAVGPSAESGSPGSQLFNPGRTRKPIEVSGKISSGLNESFQLTLGGLFSQGSNFQNCATVDVKNLITQNSTLRFSGILHLDTDDASRDWIGTVNYLQPLVSGERDKLVGTVGLHVWKFPSVLNGKTDTVVDSGLAWMHSGPLSFTLDANVKTLATGPNRKGVGGQIYYFRGVTSHSLVRKSKLTLALQHGPSCTYSNRFYGVNGHRVFRYEVGAVVQHGNWGMDVIFRPQLALQRGIPENQFWGFNVFYTFKS